jgi:polysaccharide deacetylase family protein (PEP-CTERM system associated)
LRNILSIDVEEYFQVEAFWDVIPRKSWDSRQSRLTMNIMRLLDILEQHHTKATFFTLGWVADRYPQVMEMIRSRDHEIASHGYSHRSLRRMSEDEFKSDLDRSLEAIQRACGVAAIGFRAPTFSARREQEWIWTSLIAAGFKYDSSIYPVKHDLYGDPAAPRCPYVISAGGGSLLEIPPTTYKFFGKIMGACGGGTFRLFPYWFSRRAIRAYNKAGYPAMIYLHPWEIDAAQPRLEVDAKTRLRHYGNLPLVAAKLCRLLQEFEFGSVRDVYTDIDSRLEAAADSNSVSR